MRDMMRFPGQRGLAPFRAAEDGTGAGAEPAPAAAAPPAAAPAEGAAPGASAPAAQAAPTAKWWEGLGEAQKAFLTPKGLTMDDPMAAMPKLIDIAANAEKRIGRGLDSILDKPAKDQKLPEWLAANRAALGLPDKADAYAVKAPEDWPKDVAWDAQLEGAARDLAFQNAVPPDVHQAYVALFAAKMKALNDGAEGQLAQARTAMMADLRRDFGDETDATITRAKQAAQHFGEAAGLDARGIEAMGQVLSSAVGDAGTIRFLAAIQRAMGEDSAVGMGKGGSLTMTPADARAALAKFEGPDGEFGKAFAAQDQMKLRALSAQRVSLAKLAAAG